MYHILFALVELAAAGVFLLPLFLLYGKFTAHSRMQIFCSILFGFYFAAVLALVGFPSILDHSPDVTLNLIPQRKRAYPALHRNSRCVLFRTAVCFRLPLEISSVAPKKSDSTQICRIFLFSSMIIAFLALRHLVFRILLIINIRPLADALQNRHDRAALLRQRIFHSGRNFIIGFSRNHPVRN